MKILNTVLAAATLFAMASCSEDSYKMYDPTQTDNIFFDYKNEKNVNDSTIAYNFGYDIAQEHIVDIPVTLMGMPSDRDRTIDVKAVADSTEMVESKHYTIERALLRAGKVNDTIKVKLLRPEDPVLQERQLRLYLEISENSDLRPSGQKTFSILGSDIRPTERPAWWLTWSPMPEYSFENAQLFFKYFYELAPKANKDVFDEMIAKYGDYFVKGKSTQGPLSMYDAYLAKYVLIPMYNDTKDKITWQSVPVVN